jgi:hypothetical protein
MHQLPLEVVIKHAVDFMEEQVGDSILRAAETSPPRHLYTQRAQRHNLGAEDHDGVCHGGDRRDAIEVVRPADAVAAMAGTVPSKIDEVLAAEEQHTGLLVLDPVNDGVARYSGAVLCQRARPHFAVLLRRCLLAVLVQA